MCGLDETNLSLQTVRTITGRDDHRDRTTRKRLERIAPDRAAEAHERAQRRSQAALPQRVGRVLQEGAALAKEARGLAKR